MLTRIQSFRRNFFSFRRRTCHDLWSLQQVIGTLAGAGSAAADGTNGVVAPAAAPAAETAPQAKGELHSCLVVGCLPIALLSLPFIEAATRIMPWVRQVVERSRNQ